MSVLDTLIALRNRNRDPEGRMGFMDHIEELRWHLIRSIAAIMIGAIAVWFNIEFFFDKVVLGPAHDNFISYQYINWLATALDIPALQMKGVALRFQNIELTGQFMLSFSVAAMMGFIIVSPYVFWEIWRFIKPALRPTEVKKAKGIVLWCSLLFVVGVAFAYFVVCPFTINFFADYQLSPQFENIITIDSYYENMSDLILGLGVVFELPVLVYFLSKLGILTPRMMRGNRRYAIVIILFLAAIITPPDWFSIFLVFIPLYALYEAGIYISSKVSKEREVLKNQDLDW